MVPRLSGGVAHAMAAIVVAWVRDGTCGAETRVVFVHRKDADRVHISPDDLVLDFREMFAPHASNIEECSPLSSSLKFCRCKRMGSRHAAFRLTALVVSFNPPAITAMMLHRCSAPCKALRFAPPALRAAFGP